MYIIFIIVIIIIIIIIIKAWSRSVYTACFVRSP